MAKVSLILPGRRKAHKHCVCRSQQQYPAEADKARINGSEMGELHRQEGKHWLRGHTQIDAYGSLDAATLTVSCKIGSSSLMQGGMVPGSSA